MPDDIDLMRLRARVAELEPQIVRSSLPLGPVRILPAGRIPPPSETGAGDGDGDPRAPDFDDAGWQLSHEGETWGGRDAWALLRLRFRVSDEWRGEVAGARVRVHLALSADQGPGGLGGSEALAYLDGVPYQGLDPNHRTLDLSSDLCDGQTHLIAVEAYSGPRPQLLEACRLELVDLVAERLYFDLLAGVDAASALPDGGDRDRLLALLVRAENQIERRVPAPSSPFFASLARAGAILADGLAALAAACPPAGPRVAAVGHAHIDTAWLWTLAQTRRKVARSWATALRLMDRYPEFRFLATQPQQYAWLAEDEPHLLRQIAERERTGEWEAGGAMWVEPDVLLTSGESLVRQLLFGQRFLREHFGHICRFLWLPDTFGYSPALPQILRGAGVDSFITSKISWNETNQLPHDVFRWRGLDGSEVLAWLLTTPLDQRFAGWIHNPESHLHDISTYNSALSAPEVIGSWTRFHDKALTQTVLCAFGFGDGGGGPTGAMLEAARRFAALPGLPRVVPSTVQGFLDATHASLAGEGLAVWDGELYLEYHRGTYTSQGWIKRANRWAEHLYHDAELWAAWAGLYDDRGLERLQTLNRGRQIVLRNQFHDILPGSSIGAVYDDARREHAEAAALAEEVRAEAQSILAARLAAATSASERDGAPSGAPPHATAESAGPAAPAEVPPPGAGAREFLAIAFNGVPAPREDPWEILLPSPAVGADPSTITVTDLDGAAVPVQVLQPATALETPSAHLAPHQPGPRAGQEAPAAGAQRALLVSSPLPGLGYRTLQVRIAPREVPAADPPATGIQPEPARSTQEWVADPSRAADALEISTEHLENRFFRLTLDARGVWSSLLDKRYDRQVLAAEGGGNALVAFEDKPLEFDAWDINAYYVDKAWPIDDVAELRVVETGPLRGGLEIVRRYQASTIRQRILLHARLPRIDVVTQIDWHERQTLVKAAFPLAVRSSRATYECAFGHVERPTHRNTSWDAARFEVPAHRWADLSEAGYGVSLLNDGKYGHDCLGHVLRLTLLKSAVEPDPLADEGQHRFTYALWPHGPSWSVEETVRQSYTLNLPPRALLLPGSAAPGSAAGPAVPAHPLTRPVGGSSLLMPRREEGVAALVTCDRPQVVLDTVKTAEDGDGLIVRLYDCAGSRGPATLTFAGPVERATFCNLLEEPLAGEGPVCEGHTLRLYVEPFQVCTLRVSLGPLDL